MKSQIELVPFLNELQENFKLVADTTVELVPDWERCWMEVAHYATAHTGRTTISHAALRHAVALTLLHVDEPISDAKEFIRTFQGRSSELAYKFSEIVSRRAGFLPNAATWRHGKLLRDFAGEIGTWFVSECFHGFAREDANHPERREKRENQAFVYSCLRMDPSGTQFMGFLADYTESTNQLAHVTLPPEVIVAAIQGFKRLEMEEQLGAATVALMHYGTLRTYTKHDLLKVITMIAEIESSNA
ncbi:MAG: hypothetical protein WC866_04695 [Patescibacteria group bacterium]